MISAAFAPPKLFTLVVLSGLSVASLNMFLPSLSKIADEFQIGYGLLASVSIAGYAGTTTVLQMLIGPLSDRVGRRPVVLVSHDLCGCVIGCCSWMSGRFALSHDGGGDRLWLRFRRSFGILSLR